MKKIISAVLAVLLLAAFAGCGPQIIDGDGMLKEGYTHIDQETAAEMMTRDDGHVIVDVRRQDEYEEGHIPGAILVPNESIGSDPPEALPDKGQIILIYCRSGNRSKQAAEKLAGMGYTDVYEFGGINTWKGDIVKGVMETEQTPQGDPYGKGEAARPVPMLVIKVNDNIFYAYFEDNSSAEALAEKLSSEAIEVEMRDYGNFEKVGDLPWALPQNDESVTTKPGDVILYQGNKITIYYGRNTWELTRLAKISSVTGEELLEAFGSGEACVKFWVEWSE